ncbi:uncharacterized protein LOC108907566 [Anoplophora glabripennis]|uniref:uncharacterized protein LOC108907566 n=1 Tax=Anoplophora glabripennis TaxID=217634 RepID=UPI0008757127|nr:uncharacterized protein LOC108907566 [Anoplophora glabripennis]
MPGRRCAMYGCNNSRISTKTDNPEIVYHNFPKGKQFGSNIIRKEWIRCCKRGDNWNPSTSQICSIHFVENDYERDMRNELLGLPPRKLLKTTAVPSLFLPNKPQDVTSLRAQRYNNKTEIEELQRKEKINKLIVDQVAPSTSTTPIESNLCLDDMETCNESEINMQVKYKKLLHNYNALKSKVKIMKRKLNLQQRQLQYYKLRDKTRRISLKKKATNIMRKIHIDGIYVL